METRSHINPHFQTWLLQLASRFWMKLLTKGAQLHEHHVLMVATQPLLSPATPAWTLNTRFKIPILLHGFALTAPKQMEPEAEARESALFLYGTFPSTFNQWCLRNEGSTSIQSSTGNISQCSIIILRLLWRVFSLVIFFPCHLVPLFQISSCWTAGVSSVHLYRVWEYIWKAYIQGPLEMTNIFTLHKRRENIFRSSK